MNGKRLNVYKFRVSFSSWSSLLSSYLHFFSDDVPSSYKSEYKVPEIATATSLRSRRKCKELLQFLDMHFVIGVKVVPKRQGLAQKSRYNIITTWQGTAETSDSLSLSLVYILLRIAPSNFPDSRSVASSDKS
jgi:hypothetical protein